jgi:tetratricopeptide (TPR) repeat protein
LLGLVKYREGHPDQSLDEYSAAAKLSALSADDLRIVALDYIDLRDLPHAEQWLKESIRRNGKDWRTWRYLGGVEYSEEHAADAAAAFQQCLALDPENALAEDGLARSHEAMGQSAAAEAEYRKAVELDKAPDQSELPFLHYGAYLRKVGRLPDATTELTKAISLSPQDWEPHSELGQTKRDAGDLQSAASEMEEAIRLAPDRPRLRMILAQIYKREGYPDKAEAEIRIYTQTVKKADSNREDLDR